MTDGPYPSVDLYWYDDRDPTVAPGMPAPFKQILIRTDSPGIYWKSGPADTDWTLLTAGGGGGGSGAITSGSVASGSIASGAVQGFFGTVRNIASGTVGVTDFGSGAVVAGTVGSGAIRSGNIASGQVGQFAISSGAVTSGRLGVIGAPDGTKFLRDDFTWGNSQPSSGSVASGAVASGAVQGFFGTTRNIASGTVGVTDFGSGAVVAGTVGSGAIRSGNIASGQVGQFAISSGAVTSGRIGVTGAPDGTKFLRDDFTWTSPSSESASNVLTFRPGSADTGPIVFNTWAPLYARLVVLRDNATADVSGRFTVVFDSSLAPCVIPSNGNTYDMVCTEWSGALGGPSRADLQVGDGVGADITIINLLLVTSLAITSAQTTPPIQTTSTVEMTLNDTLIDAQGGGTTVIAANFTTLRLGDESALLGLPGTPALALSGSNQLEILIDGANAQVGANSLGSAGASDIVQIFMQSASGLVSLTQTDLVNPLSWSDDTSGITTRAVNRSGPFLPPLVGGASPIDLTSYGDPGGTIGYCIEVTGATPTVLLPAAVLFEKGELLAIKRVDTVVDASATITLTPSGAEKVDNAASYTFTGAHAWVILEARGTDATGGWSGWSVVGQGPWVSGEVSTFAAGSVPFAGSTGALAQDNVNFFWNNTTKRLGIGNNTPTTPLDVTGVARATNMTIAAMTLGSILFAGVAGVVSQDNANFFWDATNHRLGIGTTTPDSPLHVVGAAHITGKLTVDGAIDPTSLTLVAAGNLAYLENANGVSAAVSPANRGRLIYNTTAQKWQVSENGVAYASLVSGASMAIGGTVTSGTTGSALFIGAGPVLSQDNTNYFWDNTNKRLGIGTAAPGVPIHIVRPMPADGLLSLTNTGTGGAASDGYSDVLFNDNGGTLQGALGYGNATVAVTHLRSLNFLYSAVSKDWILANPTVQQFVFGMTAASAYIEFANGSSAATSPTTHGRLRYNTSTDRFQISRNTSAYAELTSIVSASAAVGPVWFSSNGINQLIQNATFLWDNTNNRLGINTASPALSLDVRSSSNGVGCVNVACTSTSGDSSITFCAAATPSTAAGSFGFGNSNSTPTHIRSKLFLSSASADFVMANATRNEFTFGITSGSTFMEIANGSSAAASSANTGRLVYTTTGQKAQLSFNTAGYFDIATYAAALTSGSVPFANSSNQLAQNNANFFWDNSNKRLGIQTATPGYALEVRDNINQATIWTSNSAANGFSGINFGDEAGPSVSRMSIGHGGSTLGTTYLRNLNFAFTGTDTDFVFADSTQVEYRMSMGNTLAAFSIGNGSGVAAGVGGMATLIWDGATSLYVSFNGAAPVLIV